jgi:hypothetical protein
LMEVVEGKCLGTREWAGVGTREVSMVRARRDKSDNIVGLLMCLCWRFTVDGVMECLFYRLTTLHCLL